MKLTKKQLKLEADIHGARLKILAANKELWALLAKHKCIARKTDYDSAVCMICHDSLGWWCPKSNDHLCEYSVNSDSCDFCGDPEERK